MDDWHNWRQCLSWVKIDESYLYDANQTLTWFSPPRPMMSDPLISSMAATRVRGGRPNWNPQCTWHAQKPTVQETCAVTHRALSMRKPQFEKAPMIQMKVDQDNPKKMSSIFFWCWRILCIIGKYKKLSGNIVFLLINFHPFAALQGLSKPEKTRKCQINITVLQYGMLPGAPCSILVI